MRLNSIRIKVFLLLFGITLSMVLLLVFAVSQGFNRGFNQYKQSLHAEINGQIMNQLEAHYRQHGNWQEFVDNRVAWWRLLVESIAEREDGQTQLFNSERQNRHRWGKMFKYHALLNANKQLIAGRSSPYKNQFQLQTITYKSQIVGFLRVPQNQVISVYQDKKFNHYMQQWLFILVALALLLTLLLSWPIAVYFTRPIRALNEATEQLTRGDYEVQIKTKRRDELGLLAKNFNQLSQTLQANTHSMNNLFTDISHELLTPVAVLRAQIEAWQDGIQSMDTKSLNSLHQQVMDLSALIQDIQDLADADAGSLQYRMESINLKVPLEQALQSFSQQLKDKNLTIEQQIDNTIWIKGDDHRLRQLFNNLIHNAIRYTDVGGEIKIQLSKVDEVAIFTIEDSAPGVADEHHEQLFDRLFRVEISRSKKQGGSGLGLAIVKNIVTAHGGQISSAASSLGGVKITMTLATLNN